MQKHQVIRLSELRHPRGPIQRHPRQTFWKRYEGLIYQTAIAAITVWIIIGFLTT